ncbi:hypothetical protein [Mycobacteroides abscessus]|uniref:hypothetical protein n=1 Tax=Mycobacteroides abscessus TaxID=36809 RepID=UPI00232F33D4|nr:hypothetical protein [Mycobacteroides abscessus]
MLAINFAGAIASLVALILYLAGDIIGRKTIAIIGIACIVGISAYLAWSGKRIIDRTSRTLLNQVGEEQEKTVGAIQERFSGDIKRVSDELAKNQLELDKLRSTIAAMARLSLELRKIEFEASRDENPTAIVRDLLRESVVSLETTASVLSGFRCRVCIKLMYDHTDESKRTQRAVKSIVRSNTVKADLRNGPDFVDANTDFSEILNNRKPYWFSGDIHDDSRAEIAGYSNTSHSRPYHSVIVWPLRTFEIRSVDYPRDGKGNIIGFLCLDSDAIDAFRADREVKIGWWFVDTLAGTVDQLLKKKLIQI